MFSFFFVNPLYYTFYAIIDVSILSLHCYELNKSIIDEKYSTKLLTYILTYIFSYTILKYFNYFFYF